MKNVKRMLIVCGMVSECDLIHDAAELASEMRAELFVLTVVYNPFGIKGLSLPRPSLEKDYQKLIESTTKKMRDMISREQGLGIPITTQIREGKPVNEILKVVEEKNIDLLVLPAHEQTRLETFVSGGINKVLFRKMPCSVLFLKSEPKAVPEEEEEEEEEESRSATEALGYDYD